MKWRSAPPERGQVRITKKYALWPVNVQGWYVWFEWYNLHQYFGETIFEGDPCGDNINKWLFKGRTFCDRNNKHATHIVIPVDEYNYHIEKNKNIAYLVERSLRAKLPNKYLQYTQDPFCPDAPIENPITFIQLFTKIWIIAGAILGLSIVAVSFVTLVWVKIVISILWIIWGLFVFIIRGGFDVD